MKYWIISKQSIRAIFANKGRSFLTVLGIIIGIGSVIALISMGNGVQANINSQIGKLGTTNLTITPGGGLGAMSSATSQSSGQSSGMGSGSASGGGFGGSTSTLSEKDLKSLADTTKNPKIKAVTGTVSGSVLVTVGADQRRITVAGVAPAAFDINLLSVEDGKLFDNADVTAKNKVLVLGSKVAVDVYGTTSPIGREITIDGDVYEIIGVLSEKAESGFSNPNTQMFTPYSAAMVTFKNGNFSTMIAQAVDEASVEEAKAEVQATLLANHGITDPKKADFSILSSKDLLSTVSSITGVLTSLLAGIAAISLVVGGIGIMNIMLVSVTERTREIGLRKAVGAKTSDILLQFIVEAFLLTLAGGVIGIFLGFLVGKVLSGFLGFTPIVTMSAIALAVGVSSAVGLIFGIYPAAKAALLNPIDALRYE
ncbi:MAG: FtsX-like permease family protein [Coriobacteriia bacterium]|nr:FtsX-like permease family protein [Coriobacteriia bacterium]